MEGRPAEPSAAGVLGLLRDFRFTWRHVAQRPGLLAHHVDHRGLEAPVDADEG